MQKYLPFLTLFILVSLIMVSTYRLSKQKENQSEQPSRESVEESELHFNKVSITLPEFSLLNLFDNNDDFSQKDLVGKYSLVNFFASWCTTCRAEHEILINLQKENIIDIYGIAWRDIDENTKDFLKENGNPFKKVGADNAGLFTKITGIQAVPETVIVDKKGNVVMRYRGNLQEFSVDEIKKFLREHKN